MASAAPTPSKLTILGRRRIIYKAQGVFMDMKSRITVGDVMTRKFVAVRPETSLYACSKEMVKNKVGSLIIKNDDKVHGILTEGDIINAMVKRKNPNIRRIQARDIAVRKLITIKPDEDILTAISKMRKSYHKRLPVVAGGKVVGMITIKDILKIQPGLFTEISDSFKIREEIEKMQRVSQANGARLRGEGICEECGNFETLYKTDGALLCENCMA